MTLFSVLAGRRAVSASGAIVPAILAAICFLGLPFGRPGRPFLTYDPSLTPWQLGSPWVWLVFVGAVGAIIVSVAPLRLSVRGNLLVGFAATGFVSGTGWLIGTGTPFGIGSVLALGALLVVAGYGLSESGLIQSDAFISSSILYASLFILLLIVFPLFMVLRSAVVVDGVFTLDKVVFTLRSPLFLFLDNPYTPRDEMALFRGFTLAGLVAGVGWKLLQRASFWRVLLFAAIGTIVGASVGMMLLGRGALPTSLLLAVIVSVVATLSGLAFALLGQRTRFGFIKGSLGAVSLLPIITPPFVLAFAMIFLFGRRGVITYDLLGISSNALFGLPGVATTQILAYTPIAYLIILGSVNALDPALEEVANTLGASRWHLFKTVTWPLLRPGLANAFLLTMIESFSDFGNPIILGGDRSYLATEVFSAFAARFDPNEAAVYGTILLFIVLLVFVAQNWWLGQSSFVTVTGKPSSGRFSPLPRAFEACLLLVFVVWTALVLSLYFAIVFGSFVKLWGVDNTLTLQHYKDFMAAGWPVFLYTVRVAAISAVPGAIIGFLIGYLVVRQRFFGRKFVEFGSMLSFAIPGTVMGIGYILAFNTGPWLLTSSALIISLAFIFRYMPVGIRGAIAGLAQIDVSLEEASTTLSASSSVTLRRILMPLLIYALIGGLIFGFVRGMTAVSQVIFLVSPGNMLATVLLLGWVEQGQLGRAAAMATILIVTMLSVILLLMLITRRRKSTAGVNP